jgi:hypothetical protein
VTAGELGQTAAAEHEQPMTELEHPGGDSILHDPNPVSDGPFTVRQLLRLDEALRAADQQSGLTFSVYIGELETPTRDHAERLHRQIDGADRAVLIAISPNQRRLEIVTGNEARKRITDRDAKLAGLSMSASFAGGDLAGGVLSGVDQLAGHAGRH